MTLQAEDLMIGDWVQIADLGYNSMRGEYHQIDWIRTSELGLDNRKIITLAYAEPIPLTPEILEKNGFKKAEQFEEMYYWNWRIGDDCISYDKETRIVRIFHAFGHLVFVQPLSYIHQLQHALRLCKIDKEIEL